MKPTLTLTALLLAPLAALHAGDVPTQSYVAIVAQRLQEGLNFVQANAWPSPEKNVEQKQHMALLLLFKNEKVEEANRMILEYCGLGQLTTYVEKVVPKNRSESLFRIYLLERTHRLLSPQARAAIEDYAWNLLTKYTRGITRADANKSFWELDSSENHYVNDRRRYLLSLLIARRSERYGPKAVLEGQTVESHYQAWIKFWLRYFRARAGEGTDLEVAHPSSYGLCTVGVYYDLYDLTDNVELRELAGKFLTLYWAEVAAEFEPRTGNRAWATTRMPEYTGPRYWARALLYCYNWHDAAYDNNFIGGVPFLTSSYRPPEILSAIARNRDRGCYLATSRRAGMIKKEGERGIVFDEDGNSHFRRDVYYTPDYTLSTMTLDPTRDYDGPICLAQTMGVTVASDLQARITVLGTGYYARRAVNGITAAGVSIIARDPKAIFGLDRFKSNGTRVFISKGELWDNRAEDKSGWFFTRAGDAYVAIRMADGSYRITTKTYDWPNRKFKEVEEKKGYLLELNNLWSPVVIQMGRASDYKSFEAFRTSVKDNEFEYANEKLTYISEAKDTFEYWAKGVQLPHINNVAINLNPANTYASPYLSMKHGSPVATIICPGHKPVVLDFSTINDAPLKATLVKP